MSATRLPGKVMLPVAGRTMLEVMIERVRRARLVDEVVVASTVAKPDQVIADLCGRIGCQAYRGPVEDIAERLLGAARLVNADIIVQLTGDCPLVDPAHIDRSLELFAANGLDYAGNNITGTFPIGFDVRVFSVAALERSMALSNDPIDRVHGSHFIHLHPDLFRHGHWEAEGVLRRPDLRVTVDEPGDYELIRRILETLLPLSPHFTAEEVVALLDAHPDWKALNSSVRQKTAAEG